jgi:hypothetical protein
MDQRTYAVEVNILRKIGAGGRSMYCARAAAQEKGEVSMTHSGTAIPKPPSPMLIDGIAKAIDAERNRRADLTIGEIIEAFRIVRNALVEKTR